VDGSQVAQGPIARTVSIRFSLDETFDVGEDTGTPVVEHYVDQMPNRSPERSKSSSSFWNRKN
jgi:arylsulfatase